MFAGENQKQIVPQADRVFDIGAGNTSTQSKTGGDVANRIQRYLADVMEGQSIVVTDINAAPDRPQQEVSFQPMDDSGNSSFDFQATNRRMSCLVSSSRFQQ